MYHQRILGEFVEVWDALDENPAVRGHAGELARSHRLEGGQQWVGIVSHTLHHGNAIARDETRRSVGRVFVEEGREFGVGAFGGLDGDDGIGGEVCDAGDCQ